MTFAVLTSDIATAIAIINLRKLQIERLRTDTSFDGWRHEEEPGALLSTLMNARERLESARFRPAEERAQVLRLTVGALPLARLDQLVGSDEAA